MGTINALMTEKKEDPILLQNLQQELDGLGFVNFGKIFSDMCALCGYNLNEELGMDFNALYKERQILQDVTSKFIKTVKDLKEIQENPDKQLTNADVTAHFEALTKSLGIMEGEEKKAFMENLAAELEGKDPNQIDFEAIADRLTKDTSWIYDNSAVAKAEGANIEYSEAATLTSQDFGVLGLIDDGLIITHAMNAEGNIDPSGVMTHETLKELMGDNFTVEIVTVSHTSEADGQTVVGRQNLCFTNSETGESVYMGVSEVNWDKISYDVKSTIENKAEPAPVTPAPGMAPTPAVTNDANFGAPSPGVKIQ